MTLWREIRAGLAVVLASSLAVAPSQALVSLNDGRDKIHVNASVSVSSDSNVFANSDDRSDYVYSTALTASYTRRAGWIGVNAHAAVASSRFAQIEGQDFDNPSIGLEFTKQSGRTTGSLTLSAARESRADAAVNVRSTSWNVPVGLNVKYPIDAAYTLSGSVGYLSREYVDETVFSSLETFHASVDLLRVVSTERDVLVGYRYRYNETSRNSSSTDHGFSAGVNGKLIRGVAGGLRVGYQVRVPQGPGPDQAKMKSWTISSPASFAISKRLNLNGSIAKDLAITATNSYVDTTSATIDSRYAFNSRWSTSGSVTFGDTRFLGESGRILIAPGPPPELGPNRHDNYITWSWSMQYSISQHLQSSLSYSWFKNWSTLAYADFVRSNWSLSLSSSW